jgi:hypothetical protein
MVIYQENPTFDIRFYDGNTHKYSNISFSIPDIPDIPVIWVKDISVIISYGSQIAEGDRYHDTISSRRFCFEGTGLCENSTPVQ